MQKLFFNNYLLMVPVLSWAAAQLIKSVLYFIMNRKFQMERLVGAGGMPSSHSAMVCSLLVGSIQKSGVSSPVFAVCFVLAVVVMYDAMGVRREAGKQAVLLNQLLEKVHGKDIKPEEKLKVFVGHTPFQVIAGAALGVIIALLVPVF